MRDVRKNRRRGSTHTLKFFSVTPKGGGFTLLEILLVLGIIGVLAGVGIPIYQSFQNRNDLDIAASSLAQSARRASTLARAMDSDESWGVYTDTGSITLFQGPSYAGRDSDFDEIFTIPSSISVSGDQEYVFSKFTGEPGSGGTTTLTSINNESRNITINAKGTVSY